MAGNSTDGVSVKYHSSRLPPSGSKVKFIRSNLEPNFQKVIVDMDLKDICIQKCPATGSVMYANPTAVVVVYSHLVLDDEKKDKITKIYIAPNQQDFFFKKEKEDLCYLCNYVEPCMFLEHFSNSEEMYYYMQSSNFFNVSVK